MEKIQAPNIGYKRWLFGHLFFHKFHFFLNVIGIFVVVFTRTIIPLRIGGIIDSIIDPNFAGDLLQIILILFGFYLLRNFSEYTTWMIGHNLGSKTEKRMRKEFFESVQNKPLRYHDQIKTGDLQALATNDLKVINTMISHGSFYIYPFVQSIITFFLQINSFNIWIGAITFPFLGLYMYFVLQYRKKLTPFSKQALSKHADIVSSVQQSLNGIQITQAFCAEHIELRKFKKMVKSYRNNWLAENHIQSRFYPLLVLYFTIGFTFLFSSIMILNGIMTFGELTSINLLLLTLLEPTNMIFWATKDMIGGFGASERLYTTISTDEVENTEKESITEKYSFKGEIEFRNVSFSYPNSQNSQNLPNESKNHLVLKNINFKIKPNQRVALIGPTGVGKTTLAKLLLRLYNPTEGEILLDGKNINNYPLKVVRQQIGLIEQDLFLFSQSISDNIRFGKPEATQNEIMNVAKLAHVHDFVEKLPKGYETIVGERGVRLSGGEKQRVAIARAFLTDPDILILDDSMSAIDSETEEKIGMAIDNVLKNRTTIIITHRLHTIRTSDLIIVIKKGTIIAQGIHEDLIKTSSDYCKIFGKSSDSQENKEENNDNSNNGNLKGGN